MKLNELPTPNFVVVRSIAERNALNMLKRAETAGIKLRPHVKTHKTIQGALLQCGGQPGPIVVSTLKEAEFYAENGFNDILYAVPIAYSRLSRVAELSEKVKITVLVDHRMQLSFLEVFSAAHDGMVFDVFVKIDIGYHRAGIPHDADSSVDFIDTVNRSKATRFGGIYVHAGHSYNVLKGQEDVLDSIQRTECDLAVKFSKRLQAHGILCPDISVGSTPTCLGPALPQGVTEIHPGNYIFLDKQQYLTGTCCLPDECAARVVATVISAYPDRQRLMIDAGAMALSKDTCVKDGFGDIVEHPLLRITSISQECGIVECLPSITDLIQQERILAEIPVGSVVQIVPNHACLSAACFSEYAVIDDNKIRRRYASLPSGQHVANGKSSKLNIQE
eukprot:CFRG6547T1